jgi:holo-[acyl-carrier protein] synthase
MIIGIGTDIVGITRFRRHVDEPDSSLLRRVFTDRERAYCNARKNGAAACFAARFAAKEAFLKALGTGLRDGISWHDMEVVNDRLGKPELHLSAGAEEQFRKRGGERIFLSLSHDGGSAVAMVVLESL